MGALNVDGPAHRILELDGKACHLDCLIAIDRRPCLQESWDVNLPGSSRYLHRHATFLGDLTRGHRQVFLAYDIGVRRHSSAHDTLPQAPAGVDRYLVATAAYWVGAENDGRDVCRDQLLDEHRNSHIVRGKALLSPVLQGVWVADGGPAACNGNCNGLLAHHVQIGVVLPGEGRRAAVLIQGRGAHCNAELRRLCQVGKPPVGIAQLIVERWRERAFRAGGGVRNGSSPYSLLKGCCR